MNGFDEKGLSILASCLEHMESSPNVAALKEGMRSGLSNDAYDLAKDKAIRTFRIGEENKTVQPQRHPCIIRQNVHVLNYYIALLYGFFRSIFIDVYCGCVLVW